MSTGRTTSRAARWGMASLPSASWAAWPLGGAARCWRWTARTARSCSCRWCATPSARSTWPPAASTSISGSSVNADVLTLFPQWFDWFRTQRHVENALALGHAVEAVDLRATTPLKWGQVDDTPFGGGAGMVLRVDVVEAALRARYGADPVDVRSRRRVIALTPGGRLLDDALAGELARQESLTLLCGRYEGFDERILEHFVSEDLSIGRYVLAGGELAAMVVLDTVLRKLPGVLGDDESAVEESFSEVLEGAPEYPHYTRPAEWRGWTVPDVLLSGHHARVREWRRQEARRRAHGGPLP